MSKYYYQNNGSTISANVPSVSNATAGPSTDAQFAFAALSTTQMTLISLALFVINFCYLALIVSRRRYLNLKSVMLYVSISVNDILSAILLLIMCVFMYADLGDIQPWIHLMLQVELSASIVITADTYFHLFSIQAIAIRKPIFYRTNFTTRVRVAFVLSPYIAGLIYIIIKGYSLYDCMNCKPLARSLSFSRFEVGAMIFAILLTTMTYSYVIYNAYIRIKQRNDRMNNTNPIQLKRRTIVGQVFSEYRTVTTAGLHLLSYLFFFVPLCIVWMKATFTDHNIYTCNLLECQAVFVIWFCRGVVDPFIQIVREPKLQWNYVASAVRGGSSTAQRQTTSTGSIESTVTGLSSAYSDKNVKPARY